MNHVFFFFFFRFEIHHKVMLRVSPTAVIVCHRVKEARRINLPRRKREKSRMGGVKRPARVIPRQLRSLRAPAESLNHFDTSSSRHLVN